MDPFGALSPPRRLLASLLRLSAHVLRTDGNDHPPLARWRAATREAARARGTRALGRGAARAAARFRYPRPLRGRAGAHADRTVRLAAHAAQCRSGALSRAGGDRARTLRHPQSGAGAGAAALPRGVARRSGTRGARGHAHLSRGAAARPALRSVLLSVPR